MSAAPRQHVRVVVSEAELPIAERVWGTGGWVEPEAREALDWLTFARLHGWDASVARTPEEARDDARWLVVARDPDTLGGEWLAALRSVLERAPVVVVAHAAEREGALARLAGAGRGPGSIRGRELRWSGPGAPHAWRARNALDGVELEPGAAAGVVTWATLDGAPLAVARRVGRGVVVTLAVHPGRARDTDGAFTALLCRLFVQGSALPVAWLDLEGCLVLRMDDPGAAQKAYLESWCYPNLDERAWAEIADDLRRRDGRLGVGYVPGWLDDGDPERGALEVSGVPAARSPGAVQPSPLVRYRDLAGHAPGRVYDGMSEFRGIEALRRAGLGDIELHGFTHTHPDGARWAQAPDRYREVGWFRELGPSAAAHLTTLARDRHPLALGAAALERHFGVRPTTLICPGDEWMNEALERALDLGLMHVSSYYQAIRDGDRFWWATHFCAPYLDQPDGVWFDAGLPVVGYFHDQEPATQGVAWLSACLDRWREAGARRLIDFRELTSAVARRLDARLNGGELRVSIEACGAPALVKPLRVRIHVPDSPPPARLRLETGGEGQAVELERHGEWEGSIRVMPGGRGEVGGASA